MFTGIIEEIGYMKAVRSRLGGSCIEIMAKKVLEGTKVGDSIAVNGVCLTVTELTENSFIADVMPETLARTDFGLMKYNDKVNLERAMQLNGRFGGHIVTGHIDGVGRISGIQQDHNAIWITITPPSNMLKFIAEKGSIAIDGVSLTVAYVDEASFKVSIIPLTQSDTTLSGKVIGNRVNLENDILARYLDRMINGKFSKGLTFESLMENGF